MKLSIVIPVFNNWNFTKNCLKDLSKLPDDHEVIVIDNGSTDNTKDNLQSDIEKPCNLKCIFNSGNLGFATAVNQGYADSQGEYVLFLNNDIKVLRDFETWTQVLIDKAKYGGLVGPTGGILDDNLNFIKELDQKVAGNFYISGWCLCAKKSVLHKLILKEYIGPFTQEFTTYFEDTDLSFRAKELKIPLEIVPVPVVHFGKMTSRQINLANLYQSAKIKFVNKWSKRIK